MQENEWGQFKEWAELHGYAPAINAWVKFKGQAPSPDVERQAVWHEGYIRGWNDAKYEEPSAPPREAEDADAERRVQRMEDALERIEQWSRAYPLDVFPEPDFTKAHEALKAVGMTIDAISASNMRHVITKVQEIAANALAARSPQQDTK